MSKSRYRIKPIPDDTPSVYSVGVIPNFNAAKAAMYAYEDFIAGRITYEEFNRRLFEIEQRETTNNTEWQNSD